MINKKRFILCLDIDRVIVSYHTSEKLIDINGSDHYSDASAWVNFLTDMKTYFEEKSFQFVVQIVSAKSFVDIAVRQVFDFLHPFLLPLNKQGQPFIPFVDTTVSASSRIPFYYMLHQNMEKRWKLTADNDVSYAVKDDNLLPPIHLCKYNLISQDSFVSVLSGKSYSKAVVMKYIANHFDDITPAENIFLLDDQRGNIRDIQQPPYGYQGVNAEALDLLDSKGTKVQRTEACQEILRLLKDKMLARAEFILNHEITEQTTGSLSASLSIVDEKMPDTQPHEIHLAIKAGDLKRVIDIYHQDPGSIHIVDVFNQTPLICAVIKRDYHMVVFLITQGADVNHRAQHDNTPLDWAIMNEDCATVLALVQADAVSGHYTNSDLIALMIEAGNKTLVEIFIERDPKLLNQQNANGYTPLHFAAVFNRLDIVDYLIKKGADLNIRAAIVTHENQDKKEYARTALDLAIIGNHVNTTLRLINAGATASHEHQTFNRKTLPYLIKDNDLMGVKILMYGNKNLINGYDKYGYTPLHYATMFGRIDIIHFLFSLDGLNINITTNDHQLTVRRLWSIHHPTQKDPFNRYYRKQDLEERKQVVRQMIAVETPGQICAIYANLSAEREMLQNLNQQLIDADFQETDDFDKTADDVLLEMIENWAQKNQIENKISYPEMKKQNGFFPSLSDVASASSMLNKLRVMLCSGTKNYQAAALNETPRSEQSMTNPENVADQSVYSGKSM